MLCCIISETVCTASNAIIKILYKVILKILVFSIYIRKSTHLTCCTLKAVAPLCNFLKAICVIKIFLATDSIKKIFIYLVDLSCCVVRHYIDDNLNAILMSLITHSLKFIFCAKLIVTDCPVCWLIMIIPFAITAYLHTTICTYKTLINW